jgi:predicted phage-related endonuclease
VHHQRRRIYALAAFCRGVCAASTLEIEEALAEIKTLKGEIKTIEGEIEAREVQIKNYMGEYESIAGNGGIIATWKSQVRTTFDSKAFKADHPELDQQYRRSTTSRVFLVK